jgi:uncharacterized membrane protein YfcA
VVTSVIVVTVAGLSFLLSASAGLGGSLILVPALCLVLGTKEGVALAAVLLGLNNLAKVVAYRNSIPIRRVLWVAAATALGAVLGAKLMVAVPVTYVNAVVILILGSTFLLEQRSLARVPRGMSPILALCAGATSGFSGTSGPLKGAALRSFRLDRLHFVGAASAVSLAGDTAKAAVYAKAQLVDPATLWIVLAALPLMPLAAFAGRRLNRAIGERAFSVLFWTVMGGYVVRLLF